MDEKLKQAIEKCVAARVEALAAMDMSNRSWAPEIDGTPLAAEVAFDAYVLAKAEMHTALDEYTYGIFMDRIGT